MAGPSEVRASHCETEHPVASAQTNIDIMLMRKRVASACSTSASLATWAARSAAGANARGLPKARRGIPPVLSAQ